MQMRWRTKRRRGWLARGQWWIGFASGIVVIAIVRGQLVSDDGQTGAMATLAESAPIEQSISASPNQSAGQAASGQQKGGNGNGAASQSAAASNRQGLDGSSGQDASRKAATKLASDYERTQISVYLTKENRIETLPIEFYVRGVLAGEMPVDFELEALKAQAIAARTYIYRRLKSGDTSGTPDPKAMVTDTVQHQVYIPLKELLTRWEGQQKEDNLDKLNRAVEETKGMIITYGGEPIQAAFFSTSNGYTENAGDYWATDIPYLKSVTSPWDKAISPRYKATVTMKLSTFASRLGVKKNAVSSMRILKKTEGNRIAEVEIGSKTFSGREVREKLDLASSQFEWKITGSEIAITTYGFGHGVGMSQWGANGMAQAGASARQILAHYYSGTKIEQASKLPDQL